MRLTSNEVETILHSAREIYGEGVREIPIGVSTLY